MSEKWVSVKEICEHLGGIRIETVYRLIKNNDMPARKIGRHWRFRISDVDKWVEQNGGNPDNARKRES